MRNLLVLEVFILALAKRKRRIEVSTASHPEITLQQALDLVVSVKRSEGLRERTLFDYEKDYRYFTQWLAEFHPDIEYVHQLSPSIFRDHITWMKYDAKKYSGHKYNNKKDHGTGLADTTVNIRLRVLKAIFNQLERDNLIAENPIAGVKLLRQDVDLTNCFTDDEVKSILRQPNQRDFVGFRDYCGIVLLLDSGLRVSEMLNLRAGDIDFQSRFITLPGEKTKNRAPRLVPFSANTGRLLMQLASEVRKHFTTDRLFLSVNGVPLSANHFNKRLKFYAENAGVAAKKRTAHVYRHTWAKGMVLNGADVFTIQKIAGWSDTRTMRRYVQMDTDDIRKSHDAHSPANRLVNRRI